MKVKILIILSLILLLLTFPLNTYATEDDGTCSCYDYHKISLHYPPIQDDNIRALQLELKILGFYQGELNSLYDWDTYLAVKRFQYANNLDSNGIVDKDFWISLNKYFNNQTSTTEDEIMPPPGEVSILVDITNKTLTVYSDGSKYHTFKVAVGKWSSRSPVGEWRIIQKLDMWDGSAFGDKWMKLNVPWGNYGIHGTDKPSSIGYNASHGCIRMYNNDVNILYSWVKIGTRVKVVGPRDPIEIESPLKYGDKGKDVLLLQETLRKHGLNAGYTDARFGKETKEAMKELKYIYGLEDDLIADENTLYILNLK
jgi:peptidoglycan hydrolase-like protein with peptidoglycan-binding domain